MNNLYNILSYNDFYLVCHLVFIHHIRCFFKPFLAQREFDLEQ